MAKSKRNRRARNNLEGASRETSEGALIKADSPAESVIAIVRSGSFKATRARSMFSAELEAVIDLIARDCVYRAMLAARERMIGEGTVPLLTDRR